MQDRVNLFSTDSIAAIVRALPPADRDRVARHFAAQLSARCVDFNAAAFLTDCRATDAPPPLRVVHGRERGDGPAPLAFQPFR